VRRWLASYGLKPVPAWPMPNALAHTASVTPTYRTRLLELVHQRLYALGLPLSLWTAARPTEETGICMSVPVSSGSCGSDHTITSPDAGWAPKKRRLRTHAMSCPQCVLLR